MINRAVDVITGQTGSGKTTLARALLVPLSRVLVLDVGFSEYGFTEFENLDGLIDGLEQRAKRGGFFKFSYTPLAGEIPLLFQIARRCGGAAPITLVLEECDTLPDPNFLAEYDELISRGRHYGVNLVAISLYPFKIPAQMRRQATAFYSFRQHEPRDINYLADVFGPEAEKISRLENYEFLKWTRAGIVAGRTLQNGTLKLGGIKNHVQNPVDEVAENGDSETGEDTERPVR